MKKIVDSMLWILTFPAAFLFAYAINLAIALILSKVLGEALSKAIFPLAEILLFPFTFELIVIWSSYHTMPIDPVRKWKVVMMFFFLLTLLNIIIAFVNPLDNPINTILRAIMSISGGIVGLIIVNLKANKDLDKIEKIDTQRIS